MVDVVQAGGMATRRGALRHRGRAVRAGLVAVALAVLSASTPTMGGPPPTADDAATDSAAVDEPRVVFVGVAGLSWPDVTAGDMPTLYRLAGSDGAGSLTVRTVRSRTCAVDGWLTLGAGRRATDMFDTDANGENDRFCRRPPAPTPAPDAGLAVPGWADLVQQQHDNAYNAEIGLLGDRLTETGVCATAVGPGAALALAGSTGRVASYHADTRQVDRELMSRCPVTMVDLGGLPQLTPASPVEPGQEEAAQAATEEARRQAAHTLDRAIADIAGELPPGTALLIGGLADSAATSVPLPDEPSPISPAGLRVAVATGPTPDGEAYGAHWLTSSSTRWPGLVQLTDVAPTLLAYVGAEDPSRGFVGRPWAAAGPHPGTSATTVDELTGVDRAAQIFRTQSGPFFQILGVAQLVVFGAALLILRRGSGLRPAVLRVVQVVAVAAAAAPVASYLANLTRWWRYDQANVVLWTSIVAAAVALTVVAMAGPWRRRVYGPPGVVAGVTATVLAVDVTNGSSLQQSSLLGLSPLVAGRFYGFGNIPFAIFVVASLVAAAALGQWLLDNGRSRRMAAAAVGAVGAVAVVVDGAPQAGADVGGILATIPGFAVLVLGALGARVTVPKVVLAAAGATGLFALFAILDWLRPPSSRTHFGGFVADVIAGDAGTVVLRKAEASIGTLERWPIYGLLVPLAYVVIIWLTRSDGGGAMREAVRRWSLLRHLVWAALLAGAAGFAANDSGIIVPALLLTVGVPLGVAAVAAAQQRAPAQHSGAELVRR